MQPKTISNSFSVTPVHDGEKGLDGSYYVEDYGRASSRSLSGGTPAGFDSNLGWRSTAPSPTTTYPYIWMRSRLYNPNTSTFGVSSYTCLTGANGPTGATGKMCYIAGEYSDDIEYTSNSSQTVAVEVPIEGSDETELWVLVADTNWQRSGSTVTAKYSPSNQGSLGIWEKALNNYSLVRTKYLFADFASLGSAVISGDFLFSRNGHIGDKEYINGETVKYINSQGVEVDTGKPAYLWFKGDSEAVYHEGDFSQGVTIASGNFYFFGPVINIQKNMTLRVKVKMRASSNNSLELKLMVAGSTTSSRTIKVKNQDGTWRTVSGLELETGSQGKEYEITYTTTNDSGTNSQWAIKNNNSYYSRTAYIEMEYSYEGAFEPNWWVNLMTGKTFMGDAVMRGVKATDGDFSGVVHATTLYQNICYFVDGGTYDSRWYYLRYKPTVGHNTGSEMDININDSEWGSAEAGLAAYNREIDFWSHFKEKGYYDWSVCENIYPDEYAGPLLYVHEGEQNQEKVFIQCSYDADKVVMIPSATTYKMRSDVPLLLPDPADFPGKTVEVTCVGEEDSTPGSVVCVGCILDNPKMVGSVYYHVDTNPDSTGIYAGNVLPTQTIGGAYLIEIYYADGSALGDKLVSSKAVFGSKQILYNGILQWMWVMIK